LSAQKSKPLKVNVFRGSLVDKVIEISNLELVKDLSKIIDYMSFTGHVLQ
jgi:hypothetical protein